MHNNSAKPKAIQFNLEALRGACAFFVVIYHIVLHYQYIDPAYFPQWMKFFNISGHFCVLIFFVLSGYVIGISNPGRLTAHQVVPYLKKRFIRIYPIYFICLTVALLFAISYPVKVMMLNYVMLQGPAGPVIWENNPLWSLNYEMVYYLTFIPLSYFGVRPVLALAGAVVVGLVSYFLFPAVNLPIVSAYAYGFGFWATGWCMAAYLKPVAITASFQKMLGGIFLLLSQPVITVFYYPFKLLSKVLHNPLHFPDSVYWAKNMVTLDDFAMLPYCIWLVALFSGLALRYQKAFTALLFAAPLLSIVLLFKNQGATANFMAQLWPILCYAISLLLYFGPPTLFAQSSTWLIKQGIRLGAVSYGLYVIHFPLMVIFSKADFFKGSGFTFAIRLALFIPACLAAAYVLEKRLQPRIGGWLRKRLLPAPPVTEAPRP
jgi:peptidoglycan/LPS O-acetylase OafA/YrhL